MTALELIAAERQRQITSEGYTPEHDDLHGRGELALAAACYAVWDIAEDESEVESLWPFEGCVQDALSRGGEFPAPGPDLANIERRNRIVSLIKAGALIVAEIERLQRSGAA